MRLEKIQLSATDQFGELFLKYLDEEPSIRKFYNNTPTLEGIKKQIDSKQHSTESREVLVKVLEERYKETDASKSVLTNIELLKRNNTYTVTTGHQLNILTGPLYFVYKIISTINLAKILSKKYPDYNFVPVYWMASEDHDFEEISKTQVGNHTVKWDTDQSGAVGRFSPKEMLDVLEGVPANTDIFKEAYQAETLAEAVLNYVNAYFGVHGLVVLDPDHPELKKLLAPVIKDDIFSQSSFKLVNDQINKLEDLGFTTQVNPREINYFYIKDGLRERIIQKGERFLVNNTDLSFDKNEMETEIESFPERFSPNVIMRPLYQEILLPNLAYLGGPAEVVYWLEYKEMFDYYKVSMPVLLPRNFVLFIDRPTARKLSKTRLEIRSLFQDRNELYVEKLVAETKKTLNLDTEKKAISDQLKSIMRLATTIDPTLQQMVEAETTKVINRLKTVEKKMVRAEKRQQNDLINQIDSVFESVAPNGKIQERYLNLLTYLDDYPDLLTNLLECLDPLDFKMNILIADD